jgi:branched-chain amino acid transport system substrate-binding protein
LERPVEIIVADAKSDPSQAILAMHRLIERYRVSAIIGDVTSKCTIACSSLAERKKILLLSLAGPSSWAKAGLGYTRWTGISADDQGVRSASMCRELLGAQRAAILRDESEEYNVAVGEEFANEFVRLGGEVVYRAGFSAGKLYFFKDLEEIMLRRADVLFAPLSAVQYAFLMRQSRKIEFTAHIVATDRADHDDLIKAGGRAVDGLYLISRAPDTALGRNLNSKFPESCKATDGKLSVSGLSAGAKAYCLLLDAMEQARSFKGEDVCGAMKEEPAEYGAIGVASRGPVSADSVVRRVVNGRFEDQASNISLGQRCNTNSRSIR